MGRNSVWAQVSVCMFNLVLFSDLDLFRKYHRGKRVRKAGVQWGLTGVQIDEVTGRTLMVDLQLLPYNRRDESTIAPRIAQRMESGGTIVTDGRKAYPGSAKAANCQHKMVNHTEGFVGPDGTHTNNVEG